MLFIILLQSVKQRWSVFPSTPWPPLTPKAIGSRKLILLWRDQQNGRDWVTLVWVFTDIILKMTAVTFTSIHALEWSAWL